MATVWIVRQGDYENTYIRGVFSDAGAAEKYRDELAEADKQAPKYEWDVQAHELDERA